MEFDTVRATKTLDNFHFIEWEMTPGSGESVDDYEFEIYWSNDPVSIFRTVVDDAGDVVVIDGAVGPLSYKHERRQFDFNKDSYYKVLAIEKTVPLNAFFSETVFVCMKFNGVHDVMRHNEYILYNIYHGEPCHIIKKKNEGEHCPDCWSFERRQRLRTHCDTCKGSGFITGYYDPIVMQVSFDSDPKKSDSQKDFENVQDVKRGRISNYPLVKPKDLIINMDKAKRYVIEHVETTKLPVLATKEAPLSGANYIISQILTLQELNPDDNEYFLNEDYYKFHPPITTEEIIAVDDCQNLALGFSEDDFQVVDGIFELKNTTKNVALNKMITAVDLSSQYLVVSVNDDGQLIIGDSSDNEHVDRVVGIILTTGFAGSEIVVQKVGRIVNNLWSWVVGKSIFFDENGELTQTVPTTGFAMNVAKAVKSTEIEVLLRLPIVRQP